MRAGPIAAIVLLPVTWRLRSVIRLDESRPHCGNDRPVSRLLGFLQVIRLDESRPHCGRKFGVPDCHQSLP